MTMTISEIEQQFYQAMTAAGVEPPEVIPADGQRHRFGVVGDKPRSRSGWAWLHSDGVPAGGFGCFRRGVKQKWCARNPATLSAAERAAHRRRMDQADRVRREERRRLRQAAARRAEGRWADAVPADPGHPYLVAKGIGPGIARMQDIRLVLPVIDIDISKISSLQFIDGGGCKRLLRGGRKQGCAIPVTGPVPDDAERILITEGWSTGMSVSEMEPGAPVVAAIDAGNLKPVAQALNKRWPGAEIVVCGDIDESETGQKAAKSAARAVGGLVAFPCLPDGWTYGDFNDVAAHWRSAQDEREAAHG